MTDHQEKEIRNRLAELYAAQEAATGWGAAVGARHEEIKGLESQLRGLQRPSSVSVLVPRDPTPAMRKAAAYYLGAGVDITDCWQAVLLAVSGAEPARVLDVAQAQHVSIPDGPPCPTCGFKITTRELQPFVIEDDNLEKSAPVGGMPHNSGEHLSNGDAAIAGADAAQEQPRWRHKKRGSTYVEIGRGRFQALSCHDMETVVIYRSETDGELWVRPTDEFEDGRFEALK